MRPSARRRHRDLKKKFSARAVFQSLIHFSKRISYPVRKFYIKGNLKAPLFLTGLTPQIPGYSLEDILSAYKNRTSKGCA